jgi:hypothetical protein
MRWMNSLALAASTMRAGRHAMKSTQSLAQAV